MKRKQGRPAGSKGTPWIRVEAAIASDAKVVRAGLLGGLVFRALLEMSKLHGWHGVIPEGDVDGLILWKYLNAEPGEATPEQLDVAFRKLLTVGLVTSGERGTYVIRSWKKYQDKSPKEPPDKNKHKDKGNIPNHSESLGIPDVDGTGRDSDSDVDETLKPNPPEEKTSPPSLSAEDIGLNDADAPLSSAMAHEMRLLLSGKGGDSPVAKWVKSAGKLRAAGAPWEDIKAAIVAATPVDEPWTAFAALKQRYQSEAPKRESQFQKGPPEFEPARKVTFWKPQPYKPTAYPQGRVPTEEEFQAYLAKQGLKEGK